tara:strand:- start:215 stop:358 length:144 start_codon:yes stop_codon:yes gene_type:complete
MNEIKLREKPLIKHCITLKIKIIRKKISNKFIEILKLLNISPIIKFH